MTRAGAPGLLVAAWPAEEEAGEIVRQSGSFRVIWGHCTSGVGCRIGGESGGIGCIWLHLAAFVRALLLLRMVLPCCREHYTRGGVCGASPPGPLKGERAPGPLKGERAPGPLKGERAPGPLKGERSGAAFGRGGGGDGGGSPSPSLAQAPSVPLPLRGGGGNRPPHPVGALRGKLGAHEGRPYTGGSRRGCRRRCAVRRDRRGRRAAVRSGRRPRCDRMRPKCSHDATKMRPECNLMRPRCDHYAQGGPPAP